jgi:hypothetical protein
VTTNNHLNIAQKWAKRGAFAGALTVAAALLGSCGGGGVSSETGVRTGDLALLPGSGTLYAGIPFQFTIAGGRAPYFVTSSEQTILPLNFTVSANSFTVTPANPGVVDPNTDPNIIPSRTVRITVRDNAGTTIVSGDDSYRVLQNFLTGYTVSLNALFSCGATTGGQVVAVAACVGSESAIDIEPTTAGRLFNNRPIRLSVNYGQFLFIDRNSSPPNAAVTSVTLTTSGSSVSGGSEAGSLRAFLRPLDTARTQYAGLRITDVQTGVFKDVDFVIVDPTVTTTVSLLPTSLGPLAGRDSSVCGSGGIDVRITGGTPPYNVTVSPTAQATVSVTPSSVTQTQGLFSVSVREAPASSGCLSQPNAVTVTDANGSVTSFGITTAVGTTAPIQALDAFPRTIGCLPNNIPGVGTPPTGGTTFSASVAVIGGGNTKVISSSNPSLLTVSPSTLTGAGTVTLTSAGSAAAPASITVNVSDGANTIPITATRQATCP